MAFKADTSFLRFLSMGAAGVHGTMDRLRNRGFEPIELERYCGSNKMWTPKVKRLHLPDLLCAETDLKIRMSETPANPDRVWDAGLRDDDIVALITCFDTDDGPEPAEEAVCFTVGALLDGATRSLLSDTTTVPTTMLPPLAAAVRFAHRRCRAGAVAARLDRVVRRTARVSSARWRLVGVLTSLALAGCAARTGSGTAPCTTRRCRCLRSRARSTAKVPPSLGVGAADARVSSYHRRRLPPSPRAYLWLLAIIERSARKHRRFLLGLPATDGARILTIRANVLTFAANALAGRGRLRVRRAAPSPGRPTGATGVSRRLCGGGPGGGAGRASAGTDRGQVSERGPCRPEGDAGAGLGAARVPPPGPAGPSLWVCVPVWGCPQYRPAGGRACLRAGQFRRDEPPSGGHRRGRGARPPRRGHPRRSRMASLEGARDPRQPDPGAPAGVQPGTQPDGAALPVPQGLLPGQPRLPDRRGCPHQPRRKRSASSPGAEGPIAKARRAAWTGTGTGICAAATSGSGALPRTNGSKRSRRCRSGGSVATGAPSAGDRPDGGFRSVHDMPA